MSESTKPTLNEAENGNKSKPLLYSRLFKFRAWDTNNEEFVNCEDHQIRQMQTDYGGLGNRFIYSQYTNLNDKYGNEIYEGDIIEWIGFSEIEKMQVYWRNGAWYFNRFECNNVDWNSVDTTQIEVISNIFKN